MDGKWLWAAYKNGEAKFEPSIFPPGLTKDDFDLEQDSLLAKIFAQYDTFILETDVESRGKMPVGLVTIEPGGPIGNEYERLFPHLSWFWWASPRNRYEALFKFFLKYDEEYHFMVHVRLQSEADRICRHLTGLGILKKIGEAKNWYEDGTAVLYEGKS